MKVWVSKYALTTGIFCLEVDHKSEDGTIVYGKAWKDSYHGEGREWHLTEENAKRRAEEMRQKKILSLKEQLKKMEGLRFVD